MKVESLHFEPNSINFVSFSMEFGKVIPDELSNINFTLPPDKEETSRILSNKVGKNFLFSPKISNSISHIRRLKETSERVDRFLQGIQGFGDNLGPVFLMPHPGMGPKAMDTIETFIQSIPKEVKLFVELRHPEWYENPKAFNDVFNMLERNNTGAVITDASGRRDCVHMRLTTPDAFIRFVGNNLHPTDYIRVGYWVQRIKKWMESGIRRVYFFMHQTEEIHSPELSKYVIQQLNKHCDTNIPEPVFIKNN